MKQRLVIFFFLLLFSFSGAFLWFKEATKAVNPQDKNSKIFVIAQGATIKEMAVGLKKEGLIRSPLAFFVLVRFLGISQDIQAGDFRLNPSMDAKSVAQSLTHGTLDIWLTALEGWRVEEIALKAAQELAIPEKEFLKAAREGYMFPDTYLIPKDASATAIADIFYNNFQEKFDQNLKSEAQKKGLNEKEVLILASLVEREAKFDEDRPKVASVLLNRFESGMKLDIDATIQYALGYQADEKSWWKKNLTREDLKIDSPYNTYEEAGLPPEPICNPGLSSIKAIIYPEKTDYLYYLSDSKGQMHYSRTLEEHNQNIQKYLR